MADCRLSDVSHVPAGYTFLTNPVTLFNISTHTTYGEGVVVISSFQRTRAIHNFKLCLVGLMLCISAVFVLPSMAQTIPAPANPQNPSTQSLQSSVDTSLLVVAPTVASTPSVSTVQGVATVSSSSRPGSLRSAGQGLPGMPGGPPLKGSLGYQDPSSSYMRPTTIGPLVCDPLLDGACD